MADGIAIFGAVAGAFGMVTGSVGLLGFLETQFGFLREVATGHSIRMQIGLSGPENLLMDGDLPDIRLYNDFGELVGDEMDPGHVNDGELSKEIRIRSRKQAPYGLFTARDDAVCLAFITLVWPDSQKFAWVGDWGRECAGGANWYWSNIHLPGRVDKLPCTWIDANGDKDVTAFHVNFPAFRGDISAANAVPPELNRDYFCDEARFKLYYDRNPWHIELPASKLKEKRDISKRISRRTRGMNGTVSSQPPALQRSNGTVTSTDSRLVISSDVKQTCTELCASAVSRGPDFLNVALGQFCQMSTKTLYPVCSDVVTDNCFNNDTHQLVVGGVSTRDKPYSGVIDWSREAS